MFALFNQCSLQKNMRKILELILTIRNLPIWIEWNATCDRLNSRECKSVSISWQILPKAMIAFAKNKFLAIISLILWNYRTASLRRMNSGPKIILNVNTLHIHHYFAHAIVQMWFLSVDVLACGLNRAGTDSKIVKLNLFVSSFFIENYVMFKCKCRIFLAQKRDFNLCSFESN